LDATEGAAPGAGSSTTPAGVAAGAGALFAVGEATGATSDAPPSLALASGERRQLAVSNAAQPIALQRAKHAARARQTWVFLGMCQAYNAGLRRKSRE